MLDNLKPLEDNSDLRDPKLLSGKWFVNLLKDQRGFAKEGDAGGTGEGEGGEGGSEGTGESGTGEENKGSEGQGKTTSWLDSIEDVELKAHPSLKNFKNVTEFARSFINKDHIIGMEKIHLPKDPEDKIGWQMFYEKLGVPKDVEGYTLPTEIEGIEKDRLEAIRDEKMEGAFKEWAKEANLLPRQAEILYKNFIKMTASQQGELDSFKDEQRNEAEKKLRTEWGKAYQVNIELAKNVMRKFAGEEVMGLLEDGFGNDPNVIRMFAEIGKNLSESIIKGKPSGMVMTPEQAEAELKKLIADTKSPLYDPAHIEHDIYVQKKANLAAMAYPEPEKGG